MATLCQRIVASPVFSRFIIGVIILAGLIVGLETSEAVVARHGGLLHALDKLVLGIFVVEILIKMGAHGNRPWRYFLDPWNVFDFVIVAVCLLPVGATFAPVLRLFRLMRVLRLLTAVPKLQLLVSALLKSLPSMGYVSLLLMLLFYVYGVMGVMLFRENDPIHFENLGRSLLTLFRVVTLEDWTDVMYLQMYGSDGYNGYNQSVEGLQRVSTARPIVGMIFFVSFVLFGTMIILNLVIGVVLKGMEEASTEAELAAIQKAKAKLRPSETLELSDQIALLGQKIKELDASVGQLRAMDRIGKNQ